MTVKYPNGAKLTLFGADYPDSLRGLGFWGVGFDEYSQQPSNIFTEIIRPALADHQGYAIWIGTPKGRNEFYRLYQKAIKEEDWFGLLLTADNTKLLSENELEDAKKIMSSDEFNQEFMCSFDASIKGAYYADELSKVRAEGRIKLVPYDPLLKVHTIWDLGISDAMAIGFFQKTSQELRLIDYYESSDKGLPHYIAMIQNKEYVYGKHFAPHDIKVRELGTGKSRLETAKVLGIKFEVVPNIPIIDGINSARLVFNKLWIDNKNCQKWIDYIGQYRKEWDEKNGIFKDKPCHDFTSHAADILRYASLVEKEMTNEMEIKWKQPKYQPQSDHPTFLLLLLLQLL